MCLCTNNTVKLVLSQPEFLPKENPPKWVMLVTQTPATRYLVSDLKRLPMNFWKPFITSPIDYQPLLRQHLNVFRLRLMLGQLERQLPQQLVVVLLE